ncbi:MAG: glycogen synthase GlgA [Alphaproteobacteria bacterium]|nr:glycogen synthase GlgA [Alphaproteobacteria bacterium]
MRVLFVSSEVFPLIKTGGLADVAGALPLALARLKTDIRLLMPGYPAALEAATHRKVVADLGNHLGAGPARLIEGRLAGSNLPLLLIDCPQLYARAGNPYLGPDGKDWPDNAKRFGLLGYTAARLCTDKSLIGWQPDILHGHDWQAGLAPAYLDAWGGARPGTIFTIHNIAYQGNFDPGVLTDLELPAQSFQPDGLEYYGNVSFLKAGCWYSDKITTVSPTYARQIQTSAQGCGFEGLLTARAKDLHGILNGIDDAIWNPAIDPYLTQHFLPGDMQAKAKNKAALQRELGLPMQPGRLLMAVISRLNDHKGMDLVINCLPDLLMNQHCQFAGLGSGDALFETGFTELADRHSHHMALHLGYSEPLAHRIMAGADVFLMPSRMEPCGLTQMYALKYGAIPIVNATGGLADTVVDVEQEGPPNVGRGFVLEETSPQELRRAVLRALALFKDKVEWNRIAAGNAAIDFSWKQSASHYIDLYSSLLRERGGA